jgi:hypothetical protein
MPLDITRGLLDRGLGGRRKMALRHVDRLFPQHHAQQAYQCDQGRGRRADLDEGRKARQRPGP